MKRLSLAITLLALNTSAAHADEVGCVSTNIRMLGLANDKICVESFTDPKVDGVVCTVSRAQTGGAKGMVGLAEDPSEAAVACVASGPVTIKQPLKDGERVFEESRSILFKKLQVVRFHDTTHNTLVYLSYSDRLIDGSPKNAVSVVAITPSVTQAPAP